jgi:tetrahydromethanopterin S-methyltransferase subunit G
MADLATIAKAAKRVSMDDIYVAIDALKDQQTADFRHLSERIDALGSQVNQRIDTVNQRIDNLNQKIDTEIGQIRQEIGQVNQRIDNLGQKIDTQFAQLNQTILQFLMSQKNQ